MSSSGFENFKLVMLPNMITPQSACIVMCICIKDSNVVYVHIVYVIESAAYGVIFTSCLCENPNERGFLYVNRG